MKSKTAKNTAPSRIASMSGTRDGEDAIRAMTIWTVENRIAMTRSQGIGSIKGSVRRVVIRLDTDSGLSGYGEAAPWAAFSSTLESCVGALSTHFWPALRGAWLSERPAINRALDTLVTGNPEAKAAVDTALHDIVGRACRLPIYELLGGRFRKRIPLSFSIANPDLDADLELAGRLYGEGIRILKVKTGFLDHSEDLRRVRAIREALPADLDLRIDYNQGLEAFGALKALREMEQFALTFIEQPLPAHDWQGMAHLTARLDTPILADESVFDPRAALVAAQCRIADGFSLKLMKAGSLAAASQIASVAGHAGLGCYGGTLWEGPIALTAATHLIASHPQVNLGCEFYMPQFVFDPEELEASLTVEDGHVVVPFGHGLGIDVNEDILDAMAVEKLTFS